MVRPINPMATERSRRVLSPGKTFAGKFLLEENFAAGSMGSVWRARDTQRGIPVAIKVMAASMADSPGFIARFEREASAAAQIGSPNVVSIFEFGMHSGMPYIVMELLQGEDLHERFKRVSRMSVRATSRLVRGICEGLHAAHESGIIHRDLKPANIFLVREGTSEFVKLLDFGIAKVVQEEGSGITATGQMIGTPNYMSPEQIQGAKTVDFRCDLWAVAVIAFRALTGQLPFSGHTVQIIRAILHEPPPVPSSLVGDLSPEVDAFIARAMSRHIEERFHTARDLANALAEIAKKEPRDSGAEPSPLSLNPASSGSPVSRTAPKPPSSWKRRAEPSAQNAEAALEADPEPTSSIRPPVPVDAPLLPVQLGARESAPPSEPLSTTSHSIPSILPSSPSRPPARSPWLVWVAAALLLLGTAVFLAIAAYQN